MAGKMFRGRDRAALLSSFSKGSGKPSYIGRVFTIRTHIDYRVGSIDVYINDRRENVLDAEGTCLARRHLALSSCVFRITRGSHGHVPGKVDGIIETHARSRFEIR